MGRGSKKGNHKGHKEDTKVTKIELARFARKESWCPLCLLVSFVVSLFSQRLLGDYAGRPTVTSKSRISPFAME